MKQSENLSAPAIDPKFLLVVEAFATTRGVTRGKLMSSYGLKVNGKIFAMFARGQFVAKLPKDRVDELVRTGQGKRFDPGHGRLMKEWIVLSGNRKLWIGLAKDAHAFVKKTSLR